MLKTALIAMTIMGCDCDAKDCYFVGDARGDWTTLAECRGSIEKVVSAERTDSYPLLTATCTAYPVPETQQPAAVAMATPAPPSPGVRRARPGMLAGGYSMAKSVIGQAASGTATAAVQTVAWLGGKAALLGR